MTAATPDEIFAGSILPELFPPADPPDRPSLTLLVGQPGAGKSRALRQTIDGPDVTTLSADDISAFHPEFLDLARWRPLDAPGAMAPLVAEWISRSLDHARDARRSLLFEATINSPTAAFATAASFADVGFSTRLVVVAARRSESLLTTASRFLNARRMGMPARFTDRDTHDRGLAGTRALVREAEMTASVDRLTILGRDGATLFDAGRDDGFVGAAATFDAVQDAPVTILTGAQWFGELRRITEYARDSHELARPVAELLIELHEIALNDVLPRMPVRPRSSFAIEQEARLTADLVSLRRALSIEAPSIDRPAPALPPVVATPRRDGPSL